MKFKFDSKTKLYIGLIILVIVLVAIYPMISDVGQFTKLSNRDLAASKDATIVPMALPTPPSTNPPVAVCGDGTCNGIETCDTCPDDCECIDHGSLVGLADDDHLQYVKKIGDAMTGNLSTTQSLIAGNGLQVNGFSILAGTLVDYATTYLHGNNFIATNGTMMSCSKLYTLNGNVLCGTDQTGTASTPSGWTDNGAAVTLTTATDRVIIPTTNNYELEFSGNAGTNIYSSSSSMYILAGNGYGISLGSNGMNDKVILHSNGLLSVNGGPVEIVNAGEVDLRLKDTTDAQSWLVGSNSNGMYIWDEVASRYAINIKKNTGNVGIGTITPMTKLDVVGEIRATSMIIDTGSITGSATKLTYNGLPVSSTYSYGRELCSNTGVASGLTGNAVLLSCSPTLVRIKCATGTLISGGCSCSGGNVTASYAPESVEWDCACQYATNKIINVVCAQ